LNHACWVRIPITDSLVLFSEDAYNELRGSLIQRLYDKETIIRVHVIIALSKLVGTESPDEIEQGERTILQILLDTISTDPAAYVRMPVNVEM
jgi:condensin complex subunit 3